MVVSFYLEEVSGVCNSIVGLVHLRRKRVVCRVVADEIGADTRKTLNKDFEEIAVGWLVDRVGQGFLRTELDHAIGYDNRSEKGEFSINRHILVCSFCKSIVPSFRHIRSERVHPRNLEFLPVD